MEIASYVPTRSGWIGERRGERDKRHLAVLFFAKKV